ncbi:MAG: tetratricopeptide repeat protein [Polyangiales bacterium]
MGRAQRIGVLCLLAAIVCGVVTPRALAQEIGDASREISDLESDAQRLVASPVPAHDLKSSTFVEERLTDGELYLRLGDYLRAAILFTDIVEHYRTHRAYPEALFLLGESLFFAGDYLGARKRYAEIIERSSEPAFSEYLQPSLSRLIEIAIHTRDFRDIDEYFARLEALPPSALSVGTAYFRAKYLYNRAVPIEDVLNAPPDAVLGGIDQARLEQARLGFLSIPSGTAFSLRAKYFVGTIHTLRKEYLDAIAAFRGILGQEPANDDERKVTELTYLALGRLYYETEQLPQAVEAYRAVQQTSPHFDDALYELAWTYIRMGDAVQAERALEVLSVAAPESALNADGKVLRGELLARAGRYQEAAVVFDEVRETFLPIRNDLVRTRNEHPDLHAYFRKIVSENLDDFDIDDFLPESARQWIDLEGDYERALGVLSDLSESKRLVRETQELAARITAVLSAPNRVSVFSDLRRQRERTTGLRNRAAKLRGALIESEARTLGDGQGELARARARRRELQAEVIGMPVETEDFIDRDMERLEQYRKAERDLQALRVEILGLEARIVASQTGLTVADPNKVDGKALQAELAAHEQEVRDYEDRLLELRRALEVGRLHVGVGDKRYQADERERSKFLDLVERERRLAGSAGPNYDSAYRRIATVERLLEQRDSDVSTVVQRRAAEMLTVVNEETANLARYRRALGALEGETVDVVGAIAYLNFNRIYDRFYELVLRADLGKVDLAWARREEHRLRVDALTRERARELQALDDEFRDVMDQGRGAEGGP